MNNKNNTNKLQCNVFKKYLQGFFFFFLPVSLFLALLHSSSSAPTNTCLIIWVDVFGTIEALPKDALCRNAAKPVSQFRKTPLKYSLSFIIIIIAIS